MIVFAHAHGVWRDLLSALPRSPFVVQLVHNNEVEATCKLDIPAAPYDIMSQRVKSTAKTSDTLKSFSLVNDTASRTPPELNLRGRSTANDEGPQAISLRHLDICFIEY